MKNSLVPVLLSVFASTIYCDPILPLVINTWGFSNATETAWASLHGGFDYIDSLESGLARCERDQCDGTVGFGGSPNENGETTLDAMIFDGVTMNMGAVAAMRRIKNAASVAKYVLKHTTHSFLVGEEATNFAKQMGFVEENLSTEHSTLVWQDWKNTKNCQPNYWMSVDPDPRQFCGPYRPLEENSVNYEHIGKQQTDKVLFDTRNHDTIGMIVIDKDGNVAAGTSTNGMKFKIPGRVGDSALPGSGAYADASVGGAAATGDGDVLMRFLPAFLTVERMRAGATPAEAAEYAIARIRRHYPTFSGAVIAAEAATGAFGAACNGMERFPYSVRSADMGAVVVRTVSCSIDVDNDL